MNPRVRRRDERAVALQRFLQRRLGADGFGINLRNPVAIDERPVRRTPTIEPQPVFLHDGFAQLCHSGWGIFPGPKPPGDDPSHLAQARFRQMNAVLRQSRG